MYTNPAVFSKHGHDIVPEVIGDIVAKEDGDAFWRVIGGSLFPLSSRKVYVRRLDCGAAPFQYLYEQDGKIVLLESEDVLHVTDLDHPHSMSCEGLVPLEGISE